MSAKQTEIVEPKMAAPAAETDAVVAPIHAALLRGDLDSAVERAMSLAAGSSADASGLIEVAKYLAKGSNWQAVVALLAPYAATFPREALLHYYLGNAYFALRLRSNAAEHLFIVAKLQPDSAGPQYLLGQHFHAAGSPEEAIPYLREAVRLAPDHYDSHWLLANCLALTAKYAEALPHIRRAVELKPGSSHARQTLLEIEQLVADAPPPTVFARWPKYAKDFANVPKVIDNFVIKNIPTKGIRLQRGMGVFTQGSCFARNLATSLRRYDLRVANMTCGEEHNSTFANRAVVDWLRHGVHDERTEIVASNVGGDNREAYLEDLKGASMFVYTMGLAAAHFDRKTGAFVMSRSTETSKAALFRRCAFRTSSVQDNVDNLLHIIATIRELAPQAAMVLTVSPVPLNMTAEFHSAIVADCVSKSIMRVAVHEVVSRNPPGIIYWPSFEMVRWVGGHTDSVYGADDGSGHHVNLATIDQVIDSFINVFGDTDLKATKR